MHPREMATEAVRNLRHGGPHVVLEWLSRTYHTYGQRVDGTNVYDFDWDLLIVLDACRADLMQEVAPEYDWLTVDNTITSVGASSPEWLQNTFSSTFEDAVAKTAYVTGNPYSSQYVDDTQLERVDNVWRYGWDDERGTIPARPITNQAITVAREQEPDRLLVHYMQPHFPCVPCQNPDDREIDAGIALDNFGTEPVSIWEQLRFGQLTREQVWSRYKKNLQYVLDDVELLLHNVDAEQVVITADHGNAIGERWLYGHDNGIALPALRNVPWCTTSAADEQTHSPVTGTERARNSQNSDATDTAVKKRLTALGYRG